MFTSSCEQQTGRGLATIARWLGPMWAAINTINSGASRSKPITHLPMNSIHSLHCDKPLGNAALVAHDNHSKTCLVKQNNGFSNAGQKMYFFPARHVPVSQRLAVNYAVTI